VSVALNRYSDKEKKILDEIIEENRQILGRGTKHRSLNKQIGGDHYKTLKIQPIEYITKNELGWCEGNIIKYITRWKQKGGLADIDKVIHYAELLKELQKTP